MIGEKARIAGESYTDFLPSAPPIGPIRLKAPNALFTGTPTDTYGGVKFEERWIVALNGGHDQGQAHAIRSQNAS